MSDVPTSPSRIDGPGVHALSNHLAVILGFIELVLSETAEDDRRRGDLLEIRDAAMECARIVGKAQNQPPPPGA